MLRSLYRTLPKNYYSIVVSWTTKLAFSDYILRYTSPSIFSIKICLNKNLVSARHSARHCGVVLTLCPALCPALCGI